LPIWAHKGQKGIHRDRTSKLIEITLIGHNIVMKYMIGSGFSTEIYEWVWFSKILNIVLKISAVRL
jgi:hypothetical protein